MRFWLRVAWVAGVSLPILAVAGELCCALLYRLERRSAEDYRRHTPNIFQGQGYMEAGHKALWERFAWSYRPGARLEKEVLGLRYAVEINSHGFRTHEFAVPKPRGTVRVICVGGSTTVQGLTNDQTYPALLEAHLRRARPGCPIEVLNFGISGVDSGRWLAEADNLFRNEPDLVLQYDAVNDIMREALPRYVREHPWHRGIYRSLLLSRLFPIAPEDLDPALEHIVANQEALGRLARLHDADHVSGFFASPDYARAGVEQRAYLDVNLAEGWTPWEGTLRLTRYSDYARILARYNGLLGEAVARGRLRGAAIDRAVRDPALFVDLCHMTQPGIGQLADAFFPAALEVVSARCPPGPRDEPPPAGSTRAASP
jgi:hypothetical protein